MMTLSLFMQKHGTDPVDYLKQNRALPADDESREYAVDFILEIVERADDENNGDTTYEQAIAYLKANGIEPSAFK